MTRHTHDSDRRRLLRAMGATGVLAGFNALLPAYARNGLAAALTLGSCSRSGKASPPRTSNNTQQQA